MFPIRDDNPQIYTPYVTYGLIALNILAWFGLQGFGQQPGLSQSICQYGLIPADLLSTFTPTQQRPFCFIDNDPNWITLISAMFMHGSWMHIIGNLWFLWIFGNNVEDSMGHFRFLVFYILTGLAAAFAQILADTGSTIPMVGASGAIGGVMGAYILLFPRVHVHMLIFLGFFVTTYAIPAIAMLGYWIIVQLIGGFSSLGAQGGGVAFWAHIGGFVAGAVLVPLFKDRALLNKHPYHGWKQKRHQTKLWQKVKNSHKNWH
jgi:membrane associated rhomboid family serine protease